MQKVVLIRFYGPPLFAASFKSKSYQHKSRHQENDTLPNKSRKTLKEDEDTAKQGQFELSLDFAACKGEMLVMLGEANPAPSPKATHRSAKANADKAYAWHPTVGQSVALVLAHC